MLLEYLPKYNNIFAKGYVPNWSEEVLIIIEVKNTVPWTYVIMVLMATKLLDCFTKKYYKRQIKKSLVQKK